MTVTVVSHITLDGVVQAPARADEDARDSFAHGGWSVPYGDAIMNAAWGAPIAKAIQGGGFLLGRRTYLDFADVWPKRIGDPYTESLTKTPKYVASTTLTEPLPWQNSILLPDPVRQIAALTHQTDFVILGSGELIESLRRAELIDEYVLTIHPILLGEGRRLFPSGWPHTKLTLTGARPTGTGVIVATYRRDSR